MNRFIDNGDGTITDNKTGLMWEKEGSKEPMTFEDAYIYAKTTNMGEGCTQYADWRLPTVQEYIYISLGDYEKTNPILSSVFPQNERYYFTSNIFDDCQYYMFHSGTSEITIQDWDENNKAYVRCVRALTDTDTDTEKVNKVYTLDELREEIIFQDFNETIKETFRKTEKAFNESQFGKA